MYFVFLLSSFCTWSIAYAAVHYFTDNVFGSLYRMFLYHYVHPYQYIFIVSVIYSIIATIWSYFFHQTSGFRRFSGIIMLLLLSLLVSSVAGGMLWKIHDMQAGFFTTGFRFMNDMLWGARYGFLLGWLLALLSIPYNIIVFIMGICMTHYIDKYISE
jgi:hypothetical protein